MNTESNTVKTGFFSARLQLFICYMHYDSPTGRQRTCFCACDHNPVGVQSLSRVWLFVTHGLQPASLLWPLLSPGTCSNSCPLNQWCCQPSHTVLPSSPFAFNLFQHQDLFRWVSSSHQVPEFLNFCFSISPSSEYWGLISFKIDWFDLLAVQGTLESSPAPQFKTINSLTLSLLYGPTLTSTHDCWKNHSFDYTTFVGKVMSLLSCLLMWGQFSGRNWTINTFWML